MSNIYRPPLWKYSILQGLLQLSLPCACLWGTMRPECILPSLSTYFPLTKLQPPLCLCFNNKLPQDLIQQTRGLYQGDGQRWLKPDQNAPLESHIQRSGPGMVLSAGRPHGPVPSQTGWCLWNEWKFVPRAVIPLAGMCPKEVAQTRSPNVGWGRSLMCCLRYTSGDRRGASTGGCGSVDR